MQRRSILSLPALALLYPALSQARETAKPPQPGRVAAGKDRENVDRAVGVSATTFKVLTKDTDGAVFVMEQLNRRRGGPTRHIHHAEDELFYVLEGEYIVEVGDQRHMLNPGDCVLGPRGIPHAWAFSGKTMGRLLISFAPAGKMEAFFRDRERLGIKREGYASSAEDAAILRAFGMELVGPPLVLDPA